MLGALIGDFVGSRFEWENIKTKEFDLFHPQCDFTDDSIMTIAVAEALSKTAPTFGDLERQTVQSMLFWGRRYPDKGYGGSFYQWLQNDNPQPYNSYGNGAAMRVSPCGWAGKNIESVKRLAHAVTKISHNHPEGMKGAEATAVAVFLARTGASLDEIRDYIMENYYDVDFRLDDIRKSYFFNETCQGTVPQAMAAFFESHNFEDALRNAVSLGGDSDTLAAITASVAGAYYGIPPYIEEKITACLSDDLLSVITAFYQTF